MFNQRGYVGSAVSMKPHIAPLRHPKWIGWWYCKVPCDRSWHAGVGSTPWYAYMDWKLRGVRS